MCHTESDNMPQPVYRNGMNMSVHTAVILSVLFWKCTLGMHPIVTLLMQSDVQFLMLNQTSILPDKNITTLKPHQLNAPTVWEGLSHSFEEFFQALVSNG